MGDAARFKFSGDQLTEVAFPLGGIGTGCISLEGRGALRDWEIFGKPNKNSILEDTFGAIWIRTASGEQDARVLQGPRLKEFNGVGGQFGTGNLFQGEGLPCFDEATFTGKFPFAEIEFSRDRYPLQVTCEAFSPFIPLDDRSSSLPVASLTYRLTNMSSERVEVLLAWSVKNPVGLSDREVPDRATSSFRQSGRVSGIEFENLKHEGSSVHAGTFAISTDHPHVTSCLRWNEGGWFDALQDFWNLFLKGELDETAPGDGARRMPASLGCKATLEPGEGVEIPILFSWCFPNADRYWDTKFEPAAPVWKRWYATQWSTAWAAAEEFFDRRNELTDQSRAFQDALFSSDLPSEVIASVAYSASILRTPTCDRLEDGTLWAWEGCNEQSGCCHGSCSHVWNYALTHAYLFPDLYRTMLTSSFDHGFKCGPEGDKGALNFRLMLPLASGSPLWHAAIDGQLGLVMQLYRTWMRESNDDLLQIYWPKARQAIEFAWVQWDRDRDGLVDGDMHNTYDINFQGPNPLGQFFYLGALRAGAEMARAVGEAQTAEKYESLAAQGSAKAVDQLWNGSFFEQRLEPFGDDPPKYQHGLGCLSDQVFGALCAKVAGLPDLVDPVLMKECLRTIYQENFRDPIGDHTNLQRSYAARDEAGLLLCSWPNGGRLRFPFVYSDEVWTGIEYQVATHLAYVGLADEALAIVKGIRDRYDGRRRNPYNEIECGSHYARALAAYGLLLAWPRSGSRFFADATEWGTEDVTGKRTVLGCRPAW
jgi:uncharacterized protein (DUF608 family)